MQADQRSGERPRLGLAIGDPAGIGPELAARLLADPEVRAAAVSATIAGSVAAVAPASSSGCLGRPCWSR